MIQLYEPDGTTLFSGSLDFGTVPPGGSKSLSYVMKNESTAPLSLPNRFKIAPMGALDAEQWLTGEAKGQTFTAAAPLDLTEPLAAGEAVTVTVTCAVPSDAPESTLPVSALIDFLSPG